ncbi:MAG: pyruvate kinase alpha/beta domain-containing protein [Bacillota bacterium]
MYWDSKGPQNTEATVNLALKRAAERGIKYIVVASSTGRTAEQVLEKNKIFQLVCVTHHAGYKEPGKIELLPEIKRKLEDAGVRVLITTHLLAGVDRACRFQFGGIYPAEIIANALRILGQGLKVCVEISCMALDAGLIPYGEEIVAIGGSGRGADTAVVIVPAHANKFFETKVKEIICKPREF